MIRDRLRTLQARDSAIERWLASEVAKSFDEYEANPTIGVPAEEAISRLRASYRARLAKPANP